MTTQHRHDGREQEDEMMAHKDLSETHRDGIEAYIRGLAFTLAQDGQSLGIAREVMIAVFDNAAEQLSKGDNSSMDE